MRQSERVYTPRLDPASKETASHVGKYLGREAIGFRVAAAGLTKAAAAVRRRPARSHSKGTLAGMAGVSAGAATALTFLAQPFSELSDLKEPPDPAYAQVFAPRLARAAIAARS